MRITTSIFATLLFAASCSNELSLMQEENVDLPSTCASHLVTYDAIKSLAQSTGKATRSQEPENIVECFIDEYSDTLLYVCNKPDSGWVMYATDTRVPAILAESNRGSFSEAMEDDNFAAWVATVAEDMKNIRKASDEELNFTSDEIQESVTFWETLSKSKLPIVLPAEAVCVSSYTSTYTENYDTVPSMTSTNWKQNTPYSDACPLASVGKAHSPAGCVSIAAAQMLVYLHDSLGVPETAPSTAYCKSRNTESPYDWEQTNYTSTIWEMMKDDATYAAPLIANVGKLSETVYGDGESSAKLSTLPEKVFSIYGISCEYADYDENELKSSLLQHLPVLLGATSDRNNNHAFIVDRYRRTRYVVKYVREYEYPDEINSDGTLKPKPHGWIETTYNYYTPEISSIGMNWGDGQNHDNEWFTLTGSWINKSDNYLYNRCMISKWKIK